MRKSKFSEPPDHRNLEWDGVESSSALLNCWLIVMFITIESQSSIYITYWSRDEGKMRELRGDTRCDVNCFDG